MFRPKEVKDSIYDITPAEVLSRGLKAVVCDLDDTLLPYNDPAVPCALTDWIKSLSDAGIEVMILSNGKTKRITPICRGLGVPFETMACKPFPFGFFKVKRRLGLKGREILCVGDQVFTDVVGGNLTGMFTVLVTPLALKPSKLERFKRRLEKPFRKARRRRNGA